MFSYNNNQEDSDDEQLGDAFPIGNSKIEFHFYVKGTLGKKFRSLVLKLESHAIIFLNNKIIKTGLIQNISKIADTPGY